VAAAIVVADEVVDLRHQVAHVAERASSDRPLGDDAEPYLDLVEPRGVGGRVVDMEARADGQPAADLRMLMRLVVVDDEMDGELFGDRGLDVAQELEKFLVSMAPLALGHRHYRTRAVFIQNEGLKGAASPAYVADLGPL